MTPLRICQTRLSSFFSPLSSRVCDWQGKPGARGEPGVPGEPVSFAASDSLWVVNPHVGPFVARRPTRQPSPFLRQGERGPIGETGFPGPEGPQGVAVSALRQTALFLSHRHRPKCCHIYLHVQVLDHTWWTVTLFSCRCNKECDSRSSIYVNNHLSSKRLRSSMQLPSEMVLCGFFFFFCCKCIMEQCSPSNQDHYPLARDISLTLELAGVQQCWSNRRRPLMRNVFVCVALLWAGEAGERRSARNQGEWTWPTPISTHATPSARGKVLHITRRRKKEMAQQIFICQKPRSHGSSSALKPI